MKLRRTFFLLLQLPFIAFTKIDAAEIQLGLAPRIGLPADLPIYVEDTANFYSTNIYLLEGRMLRKRAEAEVGRALSSTLKFTATRVPNTAILTVTTSGAPDSVAAPFLSALVNQFIQFRREQKKKFYHDAIARAEATLQSAPPQEAVAQIEKYRAQLLVASLLDTESDFQKLDEK